MEESRCEDCKDKVYQCWRCKKDDDDTRRALKASVKLQKETHKQDNDDAKALEDTKKASAKQKKKKKQQEPSADELKQGRFLAMMRKQFVVKDIARDGHCCFESFSVGYFKLSGVQVQTSQLRNEVANFLIESKGQVPGMVYAHFEENGDGEIVTSAIMETKEMCVWQRRH